MLLVIDLKFSNKTFTFTSNRTFTVITIKPLFSFKYMEIAISIKLVK